MREQTVSRTRTIIGFIPAILCAVLMSAGQNRYGWSDATTLLIGVGLLAVIVPACLLWIFQPWRGGAKRSARGWRCSAGAGSRMVSTKIAPAPLSRPGARHREVTPMHAKRTRLTTEERFWSKVDKTAPNGCWVWTGTRRSGYGNFSITPSPGTRKTVSAHRFAYELVVGPIPAGLQIDHLCRNPPCVNPAHLEAVTPRENTMRSTAVTAIHARKTHCIHGHEFSPENTYRPPGRPYGRLCRTCLRLNRRRNRQKAREARALGPVPGGET